MKDKLVEKVIEALGGLSATARLLNVSHQAVDQWQRIPSQHCMAIESLTKGKFTAQQMRPDIFGAPISLPKQPASKPIEAPRSRSRKRR